MYAQLHLRCEEFDAIGLTVPGVPAFPHFGHNGSVAWCVTHAFADIHDLYVEQFDPTDPSRYRHRGDWLTAATSAERINVRDGAPGDDRRHRDHARTGRRRRPRATARR